MKTASGSILEVKRSAFINNWENIAHWEKSEQSKASAKCGSFQKLLGDLGGGSGGTPRKICNVYPHLRLETVFPALKQSQNYYANMKIGNFQSQVSISSMDWEKLRSTARATFRNPKFKISL